MPALRSIALMALLVATGCAAVEGPGRSEKPGTGSGRRAGTPSWAWSTLGESVDRPVSDPQEARRWQWLVEAGVAAGGLDEAGTILPGGLAAAVRVDAPDGSGDTVSVDEASPTALVLGEMHWPSGGVDPAAVAYAGRLVRVEWQVCLRAHGSCAVDVDAVPRLAQLSGGKRGTAVAVLESYRVRRTVPVGSALVIGTSASRAATAEAAALVGAPPTRPARFVLRIRT